MTKKITATFLALIICMWSVGCGRQQEKTAVELRAEASAAALRAAVSTPTPALSSSDSSNDEKSNLSADQQKLKEALSANTLSFFSYVPDDATGRWRMMYYSSRVSIDKYAVDYYNAFFQSDDETHVVVNFYKKTTTVINIFSGTLSVEVHEYVDGETSSAKTLAEGALIDSFFFDLTTGESIEFDE